MIEPRQLEREVIFERNPWRFCGIHDDETCDNRNVTLEESNCMLSMIHLYILG